MNIFLLVLWIANLSNALRQFDTMTIAYGNELTNETTIFLPHNLIFDQLCGTILSPSYLSLNHSVTYCGVPDEYNKIVLPISSFVAHVKSSISYNSHGISRIDVPQWDYFHDLLVIKWQFYDIYGNSAVTSNNDTELLIKYFIVPLKTNTPANGIMHITRPSSYAMLTNNRTLDIQYHSNAFMNTYATEFVIEVTGVMKQTFPSSFFTISAPDIEPGSWFYACTPLFPRKHLEDLAVIPEKMMYSNTKITSRQRAGGDIIIPPEDTREDKVEGYVRYGYIEFVLSPEEIMVHRQIVSAANRRSILSISSIHRSPAVNPNPMDKKIQLCIWGSTKMDGQKHIWLQQLEYLDRTKFDFTWVMSDGGTATGNSTVEQKLRHLTHVKVVSSPVNYVLSFEDLAQVPSDQSESAFDIWNYDPDVVYQYVIQRYKIANYDVNAVSPAWCKEMITRMVTHMQKEACSIVVYGNSRGYSSDSLIIATARVLNIPTISELLNLFTDPSIVPDVIIAPSTYALLHPSIASLRIHDRIEPKKIVVAPSVDIHRFSDRRKQYKANTIIDLIPKPFVVGYISRLSVEKNTGLFILAAAEWMERMKIEHPGRRILFRVIGDGPLLPHLKDLVVMLGLQEVVEFLGWLSGDGYLTALNSIDVLVNPSLRAWSETFCIVNIEAMAMSIPVVTFGVGGIGEYIDYDVLTSARSPHPRYFSIARNALLLNEASPEAISSALMYLYEDAGLRVSLGAAGHAIVAASFTTELQMSQYESVYLDVIRAKNSV